ncbi:MAG: NAD(P)-binding domain-containing protein [candidate division Zixibacteria bacterium]|nr:NAD(P)-binding domain-containing protein [candidate division Zixibacteria bacterium]MBU1469210.1 NAD(P)-binding domain-containing protein [candidate division Zixibacteria bacterium]MBU2626552.1 NAD(P)-binding domain-containing protein [candidate division Zixibacteria bacterium]
MAAFNKIAVIGAGSMGQGISRVIAATGTEVILIDRDLDLAKKGIEMIAESLNREIERWGITESEKKAILARIQPVGDFKPVKTVRMVIEAIPENLEAKRLLFAHLDNICQPQTIIVSNTSTLSITELAAATNRPDKVIGLHFLKPVHRVPLVEIVRGLKTSDETVEAIKSFAGQLNKTPVMVYEYPGFITTRIIVPFLNEAMHVLMEGIASAKDIDTAMKLAFGVEMGPLRLADMIGLDELMHWMENLLHELSEHKYNPCPLLRKMVRAGHLGVKSGQGFYAYDSEGNVVEPAEGIRE